MIDAHGIGEIVAAYQKHGWILRRVLLSPASKVVLEDAVKEVFERVPVVDSDIDAIWFSRPPMRGGVAWEIRYLGDIPFALLENLDEDGPDFESGLHAVELKLCKSILAKKSA